MAWKKVWLMKRKRKRSTVYAVRWYGEDGHIRSVCVGPDKKLAEMWRRRKEFEINSPDYEEIRRVALADYCKEYAEFKLGKLAPASIEMTVWFMNKFSEVTGVKYVCDIKINHVEKYRTVRLQAGRSPHTVDKETRCMRASFNVAVKLGYLKKNPFAGLKLLNAPLKPIRVLSHEEIQALLGAVKDDQYWLLLIRLMVETAARIGEVWNLEFGDIDTEKGIVLIHPKDGWMPKGRKSRVVFISPATCELVQTHKASTPFPFLFTPEAGKTPQRIYRGFKDIAEKAGVPDCTSHDLRKTVISHLAALDVNQAVTQQIAGHYSIETTTTYYTHVNHGAMRNALERLSWWGIRNAR